MSAATVVDSFGRFGLPILLVVVLATFSLLEPDSYGTWANFRATLDLQSVIVLVGLAVTVTLVVGEFDLSVAANAGLANIFLVGLAQNQGLNPWLAFGATVLIATAIGLVNGLVVTLFKVNAFVATLGTGTMLVGVGLVYTDQADIPTAPSELTDIGRADVGFLPGSVVYAAVIAVVLLVVLQFLPVGRKLTAVGASRRAAELTGIPVRRYIVAAFAATGLLAGLAGALFGAQLGSASNGTGNAFLLPAFAAAFLGSTAFFPGRFNVPGTVTAVLFLAFLVSGLEVIGIEPWVEPIVNGGALVVAVALSSWALRLRLARLRRDQLRALAARDETEAEPQQRGSR